MASSKIPGAEGTDVTQSHQEVSFLGIPFSPPLPLPQAGTFRFICFIRVDLECVSLLLPLGRGRGGRGAAGATINLPLTKLCSLWNAPIPGFITWREAEHDMLKAVLIVFDIQY